MYIVIVVSKIGFRKQGRGHKDVVVHTKFAIVCKLVKKTFEQQVLSYRSASSSSIL